MLYGSAGEPAVMRKQLEHLVKLSDLPNVTVLVLPMSARPHAGSNGHFKILSFPDHLGA